MWWRIEEFWWNLAEKIFGNFSAYEIQQECDFFLNLVILFVYEIGITRGVDNNRYAKEKWK